MGGERREGCGLDRTVWIVLPAYNEERGLATLLEAIDEAMTRSELAYQAVIVDDGSADGTRRVAEEAAARLPVRVESHAENLGLGATLRDGLLTALELAAEDDLIVTMDADNSHTPNLIVRMLGSVDGGHDVVIASRFRPGSRVRGVPWLRRVMSRSASWMLRVLFPIPGVRDFTSGYRAYRAGPLQAIVREEGDAFFDQEGFQCMVDILLRLRRRDLVFGEVPLVLRYDLKEGESKMRVWSTALATLRLLLVRRLSGP